MAINLPDPMDLTSAVTLLDGAGLGGELLGALADRPLLLVDLDTPGDATALRRPTNLPAVLIGMSRTDVLPRLDGSSVDVALTSRPNPPPPWVTCDLAEELGLLWDRISHNPTAAVLLAHTLRVSAGLPIGSGLIVESLAYSTLQGGPEFREWLGSRRPGTARPPSPEPVLLHREGDLLTIILNRPEVHNSYNAAMRDALCDALTLVMADESVGQVRLMGLGPSFCSGGDLKEFGSFADPASAHLVRTGRSPALLLSRLAGKVTAYLHGACIGSGIEMPAFVDQVSADPATRFQLPELGMGLIPGAGGTVSIPRRIGAPRTAWMALTGRFITAETALAWGLVDELADRTPPPDLEP